MIEFTLTISAAPELLAAISTFTNAITAAKVVTIPDYNQEFIANNSSREQIAATYQLQDSSVQEINGPVYLVQSGQQTTTKAVPDQGATVPIAAQTYTMEQLAVAATQIVDAGRRTELVGLLNSFGVQALTALPKEQYGAFATELRALRAKI
jgi:hypothetical protein